MRVSAKLVVVGMAALCAYVLLLVTFFRLPLQVPFVVTGIVFLQFYYLLFDTWRVPLIGSYAGFVLAHVFFCIPYAAGAVGSVVTDDLRRIENAGRIAGA